MEIHDMNRQVTVQEAIEEALGHLSAAQGHHEQAKLLLGLVWEQMRRRRTVERPHAQQRAA